MTPPKAPTEEKIQPTQVPQRMYHSQKCEGAPGMPMKPGGAAGLISPLPVPLGVRARAACSLLVVPGAATGLGAGAGAATAAGGAAGLGASAVGVAGAAGGAAGCCAWAGSAGAAAAGAGAFGASWPWAQMRPVDQQVNKKKLTKTIKILFRIDTSINSE